MFDSALHQYLIADSVLIAQLSEYRNSPSIFPGTAPENIPFPYCVFRIHDTGSFDSALNDFLVTITVFDYDYSCKAAQSIVRRIEDLLDRMHLSHDNYDTIRFKKTGGIEPIEHDDPRAQQYMISFSVRAGRSGWMQTL